jgi:hypothetical protein
MISMCTDTKSTPCHVFADKIKWVCQPVRGVIGPAHDNGLSMCKACGRGVVAGRVLSKKFDDRVLCTIW